MFILFGIGYGCFYVTMAKSNICNEGFVTVKPKKDVAFYRNYSSYWFGATGVESQKNMKCKMGKEEIKEDCLPGCNLCRQFM